MSADLPTHLLRGLIALAEAGSLARAAARLGRSESAVSLQMSRLEAIAGVPIFDRDGRALRLNQAGTALLGHARAIVARIDAARAELRAGAAAGPARLGVVQDFAGHLLRAALARLAEAHPGAPVEVLVDGTAGLLRALGEERIDLALCARGPAGPPPLVTLPMLWFGDVRLLEREVLPLATVAAPCPFLAAATAALDRAGRPHRIALATPSLDGLRAAVGAGLGIACRTAPGLAGLPPLDRRGALPELPSIDYAVFRRRQAGRAAADLAAIVEALLRAPG